MSTVLIGISSYKGAHRVDAAIQSIRKHTDGIAYEIVLGDDGSPDGGAALRAVGQRHGCDVICHEKNRGIPAIWNTLMNSRDYPIKVILNDDILVTKDWLKCMVYFLENNSHAAGAGWPLYFTVHEDYPRILGGDTSVVPRDPVTKAPAPEKRTQCWGARPGKVMCFTGCAFAVRHEIWKKVGEFNESFLSFHEESQWGTQAASMGFPSYGLSYPSIWHIWSATFAESPELNAGWRMQHSRQLYCKKWNVPAKYANNPFDWTNPKFMPSIPPALVKWLDPGDVKRESMEELDTRKPPEE